MAWNSESASFGKCFVYEFSEVPPLGGPFPMATDQFGGLASNSGDPPKAMERAIRSRDSFQRELFFPFVAVGSEGR